MDYFDSNLERVNQTKNFFKHMSIFLAEVCRIQGLDSYRLWSEGVESFEKKKKETQSYEKTS